MIEGTMEGEWYWVHLGDGDWFPAKRMFSACGGWTNDDTWEDFGCNVRDWVRIPRAEELV